MIKHVIAIVLIFGCTAMAWLVLSSTVFIRSEQQNSKLRSDVGQLWGTVQRQPAPTAYFCYPETERKTVIRDGQQSEEEKIVTRQRGLPLSASDIDVVLRLDQRRKGLLWYSTYKVAYSGSYQVTNTTGQEREIHLQFNFPSSDSIYDNFRLQVNGRDYPVTRFDENGIRPSAMVAPGQHLRVDIHYDSQGMDEWWYDFGDSVQSVRDFSLDVHTDFAGFDFPERAISPTEKNPTDEGWRLTWRYSNLLTGVKIGVNMPQQLNPGPWVGAVTAAAPVSLFLFFFLVFLFSMVKDIPLHPMHYFFVAGGFFSFHLLLAYLADHLDIHAAFLICSAVSICLVLTYMWRVAGRHFALLEIGLSQFVYLVVFSYTFFFEGFTGLAITILCILTLGLVMHYTARLQWAEIFRGSRGQSTAAASRA